MSTRLGSTTITASYQVLTTSRPQLELDTVYIQHEFDMSPAVSHVGRIWLAGLARLPFKPVVHVWPLWGCIIGHGSEHTACQACTTYTEICMYMNRNRQSPKQSFERLQRILFSWPFEILESNGKKLAQARSSLATIVTVEWLGHQVLSPDYDGFAGWSST